MVTLRLSLGTRVLLLVLVSTFIALAGLFFVNSYSQRQTVIHLIEESSKTISDVLLEAIADPMSVGDDEGTREKFIHIKERYSAFTIHLADFRGEITYSTDEKVVRGDVTTLYSSPDFASLVRSSLVEDVKTGRQLVLRDIPYFISLRTIHNAPSCHHCHGSSRDILGTMVLLEDISEATAMLHTEQLTDAVISFGSMLLLVVCLALFMKRYVVDRIRCITHVSDSISKGQYDVDFVDIGCDELGALSHNLSSMVGTIRDQLKYNRSILDGIIIPLVVVDSNLIIEFANAPINLIIHGKESAEASLTGSSFKSLLEAGGVTTDVFQPVLETGQSNSGKMLYTRADGVEFPLQFEFSPLLNDSGELTGIIGVLIDLTKEEADKRHIELQQENLLGVAQEVTTISHTLASSAEQLAGQMTEVLGSFAETADQTGQVAVAMEEMNATVVEVSRNAASTASVADKANAEAQQGGNEMVSTVQDSHNAAQKAEELANSLQALDESAGQIGSIIGTINEIADQTNLLALNAAIEAARAGEAGKGFAVVADEVRKLAEKTMQATREVEVSVAAIQVSTGDAVAGMNTTCQQITHTAEKAESTGRILSQIVERSDSITDMVRSIATASEQQSSTSEEISNNVLSINELSQSMSGRMQEANDAIRNVADMASKLSQVVSRFKQ